MDGRLSITPAVDVFALATMKRPKKVAGDGVIERGSIHKLTTKVWDLNGRSGCNTDDKAASVGGLGADISANANTTNHPTMTRAVTAPAITFSFSFVV